MPCNQLLLLSHMAKCGTVVNPQTSFSTSIAARLEETESITRRTGRIYAHATVAGNAVRRDGELETQKLVCKCVRRRRNRWADWMAPGTAVSRAAIHHDGSDQRTATGHDPTAAGDQTGSVTVADPEGGRHGVMNPFGPAKRAHFAFSGLTCLEKSTFQPLKS